jgi:hypothetical protein
MIVAGGDAAAVLEAADEALDAVAQGVDGAVDRVLHAAVLLGVQTCHPFAWGEIVSLNFSLA